jgi:hypothetical protein
VLEKLNDRVVQLSITKGLKEASITTFNVWGWRLLTLTEHVSSPNNSEVYVDSFKISGALTVGGENNPLIVTVNYFVICVIFIETNLIVISCLDFNPAQLTPATYVDRILQAVTLSISRGCVNETSSDHCKVTGKSIMRLPLVGMGVLGAILMIISPVVLVIEGLNVKPQETNWSGFKVIIELESPAKDE